VAGVSPANGLKNRSRHGCLYRIVRARRVDSLAPARSAFRPARLPDGRPARRVDSLAPARSAFRPARLPDGRPARRVLKAPDSVVAGIGDPGRRHLSSGINDAGYSMSATDF